TFAVEIGSRYYRQKGRIRRSELFGEDWSRWSTLFPYKQGLLVLFHALPMVRIIAIHSSFAVQDARTRIRSGKIELANKLQRSWQRRMMR
ncbi:MAG: hypothetical protein KDB27_34175, partial [Planctomycetales bacterium]|nr:hypothetical protein [Planctomycetales bacterium]